MITTIIFSYDRAMQLELLLDSIAKHDTLKLLNLHVLYSTSSVQYDKGYEILKNKYTYLTWHKEKTFDSKFAWPFLPLYWRNYFWWFKYKGNRINSSSFKKDLLHIISNSKSEFLMFLTDDSYFINNINIEQTHLEVVLENELNASFSLRHGKNLLGGVFTDLSGGIASNFYSKQYHSEWNYPFSVDGHIYARKKLLKILKRVIFKNPNTLEGNIAHFVKTKKYFSELYSNNKSVLIGFELNRVQNVNYNNNLNISNELLNSYYLKGYKLEIIFDLPEIHLFRPEIQCVKVTNENESIQIYSTIQI